MEQFIWILIIKDDELAKSIMEKFYYLIIPIVTIIYDKFPQFHNYKELSCLCLPCSEVYQGVFARGLFTKPSKIKIITIIFLIYRGSDFWFYREK